MHIDTLYAKFTKTGVFRLIFISDTPFGPSSLLSLRREAGLNQAQFVALNATSNSS